MAYLLAVAIWIALFIASSLQVVWYTMQGAIGNQLVPLEELQLISLVEQKPIQEIGQGNWLVSSDSDPQIRWYCGGKYLDTVELKMKTLWPTGAVVLYYRTPEQPDFLPRQMVYAQITEQETYRFDLGGKVVEEIRIDPASNGGVILELEQLRLSAGSEWKILPNFQQAALLLGIPPITVAIWKVFRGIKFPKNKLKE